MSLLYVAIGVYPERKERAMGAVRYYRHDVTERADSIQQWSRKGV